MLSMRTAPRLSRASRPAGLGPRAAERNRSVIQGTWPETVKARRADSPTGARDRDLQVIYGRPGTWTDRTHRTGNVRCPHVAGRPRVRGARGGAVLSGPS